MWWWVQTHHCCGLSPEFWGCFTQPLLIIEIGPVLTDQATDDLPQYPISPILSIEMFWQFTIFWLVNWLLIIFGIFWAFIIVIHWLTIQYWIIHGFMIHCQAIQSDLFMVRITPSVALSRPCGAVWLVTSDQETWRRSNRSCRMTRSACTACSLVRRCGVSLFWEWGN